MMKSRSQQTSFKQWYENNKESYAEKRRARYATDPEYRERARQAAALYRDRKAKEKPAQPTSPPGYVYDLITVADKLGVGLSTVREWVFKGYVPRPVMHKGKFVFSPVQLGLLSRLRDFLREKGSKSGVHSEEFHKLKNLIHGKW